MVQILSKNDNGIKKSKSGVLNAMFPSKSLRNKTNKFCEYNYEQDKLLTKRKQTLDDDKITEVVQMPEFKSE